MPRTNFWRSPLCLAPRALRPWLTARGSLTARLIAHFGPVQVLIVRQRHAAANRGEQALLQQTRPKNLHAVRDVLLCASAVPLVYAHSLTTHSALRRGFGLMNQIGSKPLGAALFANPTIHREPLQWRRIDARHPLWQQARAAVGPLPARLWARRSVFVCRNDRLLVTEVFLPPNLNP